MRLHFAVCGFLLAALLAGCSSPPKLKIPKGDWEDFNPPVTSSVVKHKPVQGK